MTRGSGITRLTHDSDGKRRAWAAPVPWFAGLIGASALGIVGLFGGLAPAEEKVPLGDETTVVDAGVVTIGVEKALIFDTAEELALTIADDEDVLVMRVRITNTYNEPIYAAGVFSTTIDSDPLGEPIAQDATAQLVEVPDLARRPSAVVRLDTTAYQSVVLQPDVPTVLAVGFVVPADTDLSELEVHINKIVALPYTFLGDGEYYRLESSDEVAHITLPVARAEVTP